MIRDAATQNQVDAADPRNSTWVAANAGSGKTRVLTDRVARLLLQEVDPQNILCLTYTKAAAIEMQNRLFKRLGAWAMMEKSALRQDLRQLGFEGDLNSEQLGKARTLFASAIETPGGLKIQTIHSFCSSILRRFPLEAGVSPQFREMEDQTAKHLRNDVLDGMASGPEAGVVKTMLTHFTGAELEGFLGEICSKKAYFGSDITDQEIRSIFELDPRDSNQSIVSSVFNAHANKLLADLRIVLATGSTNDQKASVKLSGLNLNDPETSDLVILENTFLTGPKSKVKAPFTAKIGSFPTKALREAHPELTDDLNDVMMRVESTRSTRLSLAAYERTKALYDFAVPFVKNYEARKLMTGQLDFDDLIGKAKALLQDKDVAQWVLFRLDGGIDHVLVDEAQDTSPDQWDVIQSLTREFSTGEGARADVERTIFVVGDKQQSIYSFQGADPSAFDRMQDHFKSSLAGVGKELSGVNLRHSFRSSDAVLRTVDHTFEGPARDAIGKVENHIPFNAELPGRVDLWPLIEEQGKPEKNDWTDPVDQISEAHHFAQMAERIADQICHMMDHESLPVKQGDAYGRRKITAGDIMILVQRRSDLFHEIIAACKRRKLPIAGADRFKVGGVLAVKDLTALLSFLALPEDDLSLACALRSPLFGWSEQDLYSLAHHRTQKFLWAALREGEASETLAVLQDLRNQSDFLRPYEMLERILTRHGGRKKLLARLGQEAEDGIDALLSQALAYESTEVPSLTGFLVWMEADELEIKRQMDSQGDQIRVMTVHGSKGLEAPIVILPESAKRTIDVRNELLPHGDHVLWKTKKDDSPDIIKALRDKVITKEAEERLRLLYVAMTRAENWLIVGAAGKVDDDTWYETVERGMDHAGSVLVDSGGLAVKRVEFGNWTVGDITKPKAAPDTKLSPPDLAEIKEIARADVLTPSDLGGAKALPGESDDPDSDLSKARGTAIHLLLEKLAEVPENKRLELGRKLIERLDRFEEFEPNLVSNTIALLTKAHLAAVFAPATLAEVDMVCELPATGQKVVGTIDRLIIEDTKITVVDFKSNRIVPASVEAVPDGLLRQMGAYQAGIKQIYPNHHVETAILWTETAELMRLPDGLITDALARVSVP